jgi:hypothetical protein
MGGIEDAAQSDPADVAPPRHGPGQKRLAPGDAFAVGRGDIGGERQAHCHGDRKAKPLGALGEGGKVEGFGAQIGQFDALEPSLGRALHGRVQTRLRRAARPDERVDSKPSHRDPALCCVVMQI